MLNKSKALNFGRDARQQSESVFFLFFFVVVVSRPLFLNIIFKNQSDVVENDGSGELAEGGTVHSRGKNNAIMVHFYPVALLPLSLSLSFSVCVCVCVCVCARACVCVCVRARVRVCASVYV